jgi:hypothetical protein
VPEREVFVMLMVFLSVTGEYIGLEDEEVDPSRAPPDPPEL